MIMIIVIYIYTYIYIYMYNHWVQPLTRVLLAKLLAVANLDLESRWYNGRCLCLRCLQRFHLFCQCLHCHLKRRDGNWLVVLNPVKILFVIHGLLRHTKVLSSMLWICSSSSVTRVSISLLCEVAVVRSQPLLVGIVRFQPLVAMAALTDIRDVTDYKNGSKYLRLYILYK